MKHNVMLTIASLLSILFITFHLTNDIVRGMEPGTLSNLIAVPILVVWLYGTLVLAGKAIGVRDHPPRVAPWVGRACHPHEGGGSRRSDRQVQRGLLLYLDTPRARRYRALLRHPLGARIVGATDTADHRAAQTRCMRRCSPSYAYQRFARVQSAMVVGERTIRK
jgi:hypothetical protein